MLNDEHEAIMIVDDMVKHLLSKCSCSIWIILSMFVIATKLCYNYWRNRFNDYRNPINLRQWHVEVVDTPLVN